MFVVNIFYVSFQLCYDCSANPFFPFTPRFITFTHYLFIYVVNSFIVMNIAKAFGKIMFFSFFHALLLSHAQAHTHYYLIKSQSLYIF